MGTEYNWLKYFEGVERGDVWEEPTIAMDDGL